MPWPQRLNDDKGHIVCNGSNDVQCLMMMTDYVQLFVFVLWMKLYGFANFVEQHLVSYEYSGISLVVIEASKWLYGGGFYCMTVINNLCYNIYDVTHQRCFA